MILKYCYESEDGRWNRQKTIFVGLMMSLGIITELYCESCISEVVLELCVVVYRLCAAHIVYRSFAPFRR